MKHFENLVYLDHNATTYLDPRVLEAMTPYLTQQFANPSSLYQISQDAKTDLDLARESVLKNIGGSKGRLIFTGGGSEADNLAIKGIAAAYASKGRHLITSQIEHHAVLHSFEYLEKHGFEVSYIPVDDQGVIRLDELQKAIRPDTILVSVMFANNETGVLQPIKEIAKITKEKKIFFHTDAVQVVGKIPIDVEDLGVDMLALSAHKFYGPKGVGALYIRKGISLHQQIHGGGQELKLRAGTENVAGIIGLAKALDLAMKTLEEEWTREGRLRDQLETALVERIPATQVNGGKAPRLANTLNIILKYIEGEGMLLFLDNEQICASSGSACTSGSLDPSHVLLAMGIPHEFAHGSLRFSLGRYTTESDIQKVIEVLPGIVERLRLMSPLWDDAVENKKNNK